MRARQRLASAAIIVSATVMFGAACAAVLPAIAVTADTTPTIDTIMQAGEHEFAWSPEHLSVAPGSVVTFANTTPGIPHGIKWTSSIKPECSKGVPVEEEELKWSGTCTFAQPGTYTFKCTVHAYMTGEVTVSSTDTSTTTTATSTSQSTSERPQPPPGESGEPEQGGGSGSLLAGSTAKALRLAPTQHGRSVKGTINLSKAADGARLSVELLAKVPDKRKVGKLSRRSVHAGANGFAIALSAVAGRQLKHLHRLVVTAKITIASGDGKVVMVTRRVVMRL